MQSFHRRDFLRVSSAAGASAIIHLKVKAAQENKNVLFIAVDDLRPELGCYGAEHMKTPNIDRLAGQGTLFKHTYCQQAVCSPSRTSLMTGKRPDTTKIYNLQTHFRKTIPGTVTLPQYFKQHGYHTQAFGKIYHGGLDDLASWSVKTTKASVPHYGKKETLEFLESERKRLQAEHGKQSTEVLERDPKFGQALLVTRPKYRVRGPSWEDPDVADHELPDGDIAEKAIRAMREQKDNPFFLAVGFVKPHLPFVAPKKYFDLYPKDSITMPEHPERPDNAPNIAFHNWGELRNYSDIDRDGGLSNQQTLDLRRAYYASCSYVDALVGKVVDELDTLGLRDNTIVVLWGDHGWHLGENDLWCKHSNFEYATHVPMIFRVPGIDNGITNGLTEFVDIYPTLCELCGLDLPDDLEGTSLVPLMKEPEREWKKAAFSQYPRSRSMGYSIRSGQWRYTEWKGQDGNTFDRELYDHSSGPVSTENLAQLDEHKETVNQLSKILNGGWQKAAPKLEG